MSIARSTCILYIYIIHSQKDLSFQNAGLASELQIRGSDDILIPQVLFQNLCCLIEMILMSTHNIGFGI